MSCTSTPSTPSALRSVSSWLLLPFTLALIALLGALQVMLTLRSRLLPLRRAIRAFRPITATYYVPMGSIPDHDPPDGVEIIDDDDLATWADVQVCDDYIELTRDYLEFCHDLDPAKHRHR